MMNAAERFAGGGPPRAWVLNLDAELELRSPVRYQPTKGSLAGCRTFEPLAFGLLAAGDIVLPRSAPLVSGIARGYSGAAWCPTPSALEFLKRAGAGVPDAPSLACLQHVNHRRFHAELGSPLVSARLATDFEQARQALLEPSKDGWLVKRGFGFAGRGNRRFPAAPTQDDWRWLEHALRDGPVQIEPWLTILEEYSMHGWVSPEGALTLGSPCVHLKTEPPSHARLDRAQAASMLDSGELLALRSHAQRVGAALWAAGYFGPFGIDAFSYRDGAARRFNPRSEINARYTLAYAVGMGLVG